MSIRHFTADGRTTINWASGTSTELFIHPATGNFATRDFLFRISTATVEAEESVFTFFEGITRHLMILKGDLELIHEGRYTKHLSPYQQDTFSGEWSTRSKGMVTDFNLMLKAGATGTLAHQHIAQDKGASFTAKTDYYFIFFATGTATLSSGGTATGGDLLHIDNAEQVTIQATEACNVVVIEVVV